MEEHREGTKVRGAERNKKSLSRMYEIRVTNITTDLVLICGCVDV